jgi:hypothetical protein
MRIALTVQFQESEQVHRTDAVFSDFIQFEKQFNRSVAAFERELKLTDLAYLAWSSMRRTGITTKSFDDFVATIEDISIADDDDPKA